MWDMQIWFGKSRPTHDTTDDGSGTGDDVDMNAFRDAIATAMVS